MHILLVTDNFPPESNAPAIRCFEHARHWVLQGNQVTVITCCPNFPKGKPYPGYRNRLSQQEIVSGIQVIRVWSYMAPNAGAIKRIIDFSSFGMMAFLRGLGVRRPDVIIGTSPQPFSVFAAYGLSACKRVPFIFELRDLWPESITAVGAMRSSRLLQFFGYLIRGLYRRATRIISVTDTFKKLLTDQGVSAEKIAVVKNGISVADLQITVSREDQRAALGLSPETICVAYIGTLGMAHQVDMILDAAAACALPQVTWLIMGDGAARADLEARMPMDNVKLLPAGDRQIALNVLNAIDISLVHLRPHPVFESVIPSKIFEAMALSKPILMGVAGESADIVLTAGSGRVFESGNAADCIAQLTVMLSQDYRAMGASGREYVCEHFDRRVLSDKLLAILQEVISEEKC